MTFSSGFANSKWVRVLKTGWAEATLVLALVEGINRLFGAGAWVWRVFCTAALPVVGTT
jgi:hypothetical protein